MDWTIKRCRKGPGKYCSLGFLSSVKVNASFYLLIRISYSGEIPLKEGDFLLFKKEDFLQKWYVEILSSREIMGTVPDNGKKLDTCNSVVQKTK